MNEKKEKNVATIIAVSLSLVIIVFCIISLYTIAKEEHKKNVVWDENVTLKQIVFVKKIKEKLREAKPYDFIVMKNGDFAIKKQLSQGVYYSDRKIFMIEKIVSKDSPEYDHLAGEFLRQK